MSKDRVLVFLAGMVLLCSSGAFAQEAGLGANALYEEGLKHYEKGLRRLAAEYFQKCLAIDPGHKGAQKYLGTIGQTHIDLEIKEALSRYDAFSSTAQTPARRLPSPASGQIPRNLDYRTAETPSAVAAPLTSYQQIAESAAQQAKEDFATEYNIREEIIEQARKDYELEKKKQRQEKLKQKDRRRKEIIDKTLEDAYLKMDFEYLFVWDGEQSFEIITSTGSPLSKLTYPIEGGMGIATLEAKLHPKVFIGGRYGTSNFENKTSTDEDWNIFSGWIGAMANYQVTEQDTKNKVQLWDANLYLRMYDARNEDLNKDWKEILMVDRLYLDVFGGYQYYKARHTMIDPTREVLIQDAGGVWWELIPDAISFGLNSAWEVIYKGPRAGLRVGGSITDKLSSSISLSYAWLDTRAFGNWNVRNYNFWMKGDKGSAFNVDVDAQYHITPNWFVSGGFHFMDLQQGKAVETGHYPGLNYTDLDIVRNIDACIYGPSFGLGYRW